MKLNSARTLQTAVIILIAVGLIALALGGYMRSVSDFFTNSLVGIQEWVSTRYLAVVDFLTVPRDVASLRQRNEEMEIEIARLQTQVIELQQQVTETEMLYALVDFARANPGNAYKAATVIGEDPSPFLRYVIINIGSNAGVRPGMPVVTDQGLIGRIDAVITEASRVQLITDPASSVNVIMQNSRANAMLIGSVTGDLSLDMISQDTRFQVGDVVLTSGLGGGYPANLMVGQVTSIRKLDYELFQQATVQSVVDFANLQFVLVIVDFQPVDITPLIP